MNIFMENKSTFDARREWLIKNKLDYQWSYLEEGGYVIHIKSITKEQLQELEDTELDGN